MQDWMNGLAGGALIGAAAALLLLANGRIMGASGILGSLIDRMPAPDWAEKLAFLVGLVVSPVLYLAAGGRIDLSLVAEPPVLVLAGLLVGFGARMGSGCTSGHGVCGIPRLSLRSIVAVPVFMAAGIATVALVKLI